MERAGELETVTSSVGADKKTRRRAARPSMRSSTSTRRDSSDDPKSLEQQLRYARLQLRKPLITEEEYELVCACLDPARQPEDRHDEFNRALSIFTGLQDRLVARTGTGGHAIDRMNASTRKFVTTGPLDRVRW